MKEISSPSLNIHIITAEINEFINEDLLEYQKSNKISNSDMYYALKELSESFKRKALIEK